MCLLLMFIILTQCISTPTTSVELNPVWETKVDMSGAAVNQLCSFPGVIGALADMFGWVTLDDTHVTVVWLGDTNYVKRTLRRAEMAEIQLDVSVQFMSHMNSLRMEGLHSLSNKTRSKLQDCKFIVDILVPVIAAFSAFQILYPLVMKKWYPNSNDENDEDYDDEDKEYDDDDDESYDDCEQGDENDEFNSELIIVSYCNNFVYV